jgi:hypothetical protein
MAYAENICRTGRARKGWLYPPLEGEGRRVQRGEVTPRENVHPPPGALRAPTSPLQGEVKKEIHSSLYPNACSFPLAP